MADGESNGAGLGSALKDKEKAAGAAAATGAAAFAVQRALAQRSKSSSTEKSSEGGNSIFASAAAGGWDAARDALLPLAENAASIAGKYVAEHGPDVVRDHVVPRFIDAFNNAKD